MTDLRTIPSRYGANPHVCHIAAAIIGAAVVGGGATAYAAGKGAKAQTNAANTAAATQQHMYDTTRADLLPYNTAGQGALPQINNLLSGNPRTVQSQLEQMPGYQFALTQGLKSVQNSAAARGLGTSGAALKGGAAYATGLADQTYGSQFNRLMALAGLGENAAAQTGNAGSQAANGISSAQIGAGNAIAGGYAGMANGVNQAVNGLTTGAIYHGLYGSGAGSGAGAGAGTPIVDPNWAYGS